MTPRASAKGYICLTSVTIPDSVTRIGNSAFMECKRLTSVTISAGATEISDDALSAGVTKEEKRDAGGQWKYILEEVGATIMGYLGELNDLWMARRGTKKRVFKFQVISNCSSFHPIHLR